MTIKGGKNVVFYFVDKMMYPLIEEGVGGYRGRIQCPYRGGDLTQKLIQFPCEGKF